MEVSSMTERFPIAKLDSGLWRVVDGTRERWNVMRARWEPLKEGETGPGVGEITWPSNVAPRTALRFAGRDEFGDLIEDESP